MNQKPMQGTVRHKRHHSMFRNPRTLAELRANQDGWGRAKRSRKGLPTSYSDIPLDKNDRSWKNHRKTKHRT